MTKFIFISVLSLLWAVNITAQIDVQFDKNTTFKSTPVKDIDTEVMRCLYLQKLQNDSLNPFSMKENTMLLQIGETCSKYFDYKKFQGDLFLKQIEGEEKSPTEATRLFSQYMVMEKGSDPLNIFKNYPTGKITTTDRIPFNYYIYEEDIVAPKWKLGTETVVICNYQCKKATTLFRGRNYTAWYTPDIPMNNGPWKFQGLPGLILRVEDDKKQVSFECIGIEKSKQGELIYMTESLYIKTTKEKFNQTRKKYLDNPAAFVSGGGLVKDMPLEASKKRPYNPIELSE
ncbi:MAG: GLPGLI family protein [Prevotella sp.]|jgi:GLPGLI family protein|nr:GLPGLI family protein [Prevotella sp.]